MIELSRDDFRTVVAEARLAPSVHNIQPTRWRLLGSRVEVVGDPGRSIPVADPKWRDWRISHGTALEGLDLALRARGLCLVDIEIGPVVPLDPRSMPVHVASASIAACAPTNMRDTVLGRVSWRGRFEPLQSGDEAALDRLAALCGDLVLVRQRPEIAWVAAQGDIAGMHFLRQDAHRVELLRWLRLTRRHPAYERDGLNARAMRLNAIEALGAGLVLGPLFGLLDRAGVAAALTSEGGKTATAAAIALFHRPIDEDPLQSGRAFYRAWLGIESAGLKACPISVLADWAPTKAEIAGKFSIPSGRQLVSVFRIGHPHGTPALIHARLPVDELICA